MKSRLVAFLFLATAVSGVASSGTAATQEDETIVTSWLASQMVASSGGIPLDIKMAEARMRAVYAVLATKASSNEDGMPRLRALTIAKFLEKDLDNDGNVTSAELREVLLLQAFKPLTAVSGLQVDPTKEQSESILQQLLAKELVADKNADGTLDFAEIRQQASLQAMKSAGRQLSMSLRDTSAVRVLDTSGDKVISEAEFIEGAKKIFTTIDADKDGKITRSEVRSHIRVRTTTC